MINLKELQALAKKFKVLYVEDDISVQNALAEYLKNLFSQVTTANDGEEGLQTYKKGQYDIVITDLSMPKMNGIEMLQKIREINPSQAVLITTAHSGSDYMSQAIKIGVDGYIVKPFDYEQLNYELYKTSEKLEVMQENEAYKKTLQRMVEQKTAELSSMIHFQHDNYEKTLLAMVKLIEERDTYTAGHSQRVANYSKMIAKEMDCSEEECDQIYRAGILHDIGKIVTPDVVLLKPKKLNALEYKLIQEHPQVGYRLLANIPMYKDLADTVRDHHERCDGSGYPRGIEANEIDKLAKVMMIADTFDAMTTNRIYKGRKTCQEALDEIQSLGTSQYDSDAVKAALRVLKDVVIAEDINQLPHTEIEKERFAYFYKDSLTDLYNQSYLDVILSQNSYDIKYTKLHLLRLKNFSRYNKDSGWKKGDAVLEKIAKSLQRCFDLSMVFRIFGDDFAILDNGECNMTEIEQQIKEILAETIIESDMLELSLVAKKTITVDDLEKL
ncbi:HD domain-containing phosphohydrolase [Sulfurimonas autotrophica]|uniref:Diguanylate cyclase and metal dependent phosphohydrolase n=1 Tax=Sulfurimonas autotrophica (strain ATCC BAA-671 / DSM 16294 / JCM 11897 / OK10) TaxID=563040 RepID=E0USU1_SULAO|nr:HD domain-containing phosphohydrolase [Sulfurimonas autotrophica]ADN08118.1 diguanylate cyclase and metal dependent phosphohydrolase [Sulfurimonas autotrophica DSM 16294]